MNRDLFKYIAGMYIFRADRTSYIKILKAKNS